MMVISPATWTTSLWERVPETDHGRNLSAARGALIRRDNLVLAIGGVYSWPSAVPDLLRIPVVLPPATGRLTMMASECGGESVRRGVAGAVGYLGEAQVAGA